MRRFDRVVTALETRRVNDTARRKIGSGVPEGLGELMVQLPHCGAVAGRSVHGPMT